MLKPIGWGRSLLYFGIPALIMIFGFYVVMPFLVQQGMLLYYAYSISLGFPLLLMLVAALVAYHLEGNSWNWAALMDRFRYCSLSLRDLLTIVVIFALEMAVYFALAQLTGWLIAEGIIPLPAHLPDFVNPKTVFT